MFEYWQNAGASQSGGAHHKKKSKSKSSSKIGRVKVLKNGAKGKWKRVNGKVRFVIFKGMSKSAFKKKVSSKRGKRVRMSLKSAKNAMTRYYNKKSYKTSRGRSIAIGRDMCGANKKVVRDRRYKRSPFKYDFAKLDDGSNCARAGSPTRKRRMSKTAKANLVRRLSKGRASAARRRSARTSAARRRAAARRRSGRK